ncbi:AraC family transcriptional regulator [Nocardioides koreensis]|uniref:AraC family transcriptional regulator n=1 Tax=Nocardioides koreensis TaxID=433651 RepID=A0ABN2ZYQ1_9ACTN
MSGRATTQPPRLWRLAEALRPYVAALHVYDVDLGAPGVHRGLPSTTLTLVLPVGEPLDVGWAGDRTTRGARWSTVSGLHSGPAEIHHGGHQRGLQLALTPAGARALLGVPAPELSRELLELDEVAPGLADLPDWLAATTSPTAGLRVVEGALLAALARHGEAAPRREVEWALARLTRGARVQDVAAEVGYSRRRLGTLVREECGLAPKEYQRIARFERSRDVLARHAARGRADLAGVASDAGYADQSHLTREWTAMAGCTPTTWLREEFPFLQDGGGVGGRG